MEKATQKNGNCPSWPRSKNGRQRKFTMMSIDEFGGNPLRSSPPTSSIRQKKIEQNGKKQHKKTAIALVDLAT